MIQIKELPNKQKDGKGNRIRRKSILSLHPVEYIHVAT